MIRRTWNRYKPEIRPSASPRTGGKDVANLTLGGLSAIVLTGILREGFGLEFSPEFYSAGGAILGLVIARLLKY